MAFGDLLEKVGSMGLFQIVYVCFLSIPVLMIASHNLIQNFSAAVPEHHCQTSIQMNGTQSNLTQHLHPEDLLKVSIPLDGKQKPEQCLQFTTTQWQLLEGNATLLEVETEPCRDGWVFDDSVFASSIVTEWELVCDLRSLKELAQSLFMAGVLIGALIFGSLSDRCGRRAVLLWSLLMIALMGTGAAFSPSFTIYCFFRFLSGVGLSGLLLNYICLSLEWVPTKFRAIVVSIQAYCSTAGQVILAGLAYWLRDWRWLQLAISLPFFAFFLYSWWLPESARWLIVNNKTEVALRNLKRVAKMNGKKEEGEKISLEMLQLEVAEKSPKASTHSILDLFRTPAMCRISCCLMFVSFSTNFAYFGLSMDLRNFGFSTHLVQMLFGSIDVFAKILCGVMLTFFGRRTVQASSLILAGIFLLANTALPLDMQTFRITLVMLGKGCLSASSLCSYLYSGELFPTVVRQTGMGLTTMMARLGGIVAPMVLMAGDYVAFLPLVIFGGAPIISGVAACFLPEMLNAPLLDTIEEVEDRARRKEIVTIQEKRAEIVIEVIEGTRL
ncbi:solute carrier family 22 member 6-B-like isoform X1 [Rhinatrema bivittatum]|uniref:solute carrier family 22 member 6-B-like isoform X1 n=1 Tax=Rhinatrema bivittatum TaxID=194408 RepID=UPI001127ABD0|nr:solute carrier family 22 member 6-B-like isoform X1 [Rhinatrema bivittatum]